MRRTLVFLACCLPAWAGAAIDAAQGRWEGTVAIPGRPLQLVVDLAQDRTGVWTGSFIVPGLGVKGAPLANIVVTDAGIAFDAGSWLATTANGPVRFSGRLDAGDRIAGQMKQGGNTAPFSLKRVAAAQVDAPPRSTPVARDLEDAWTGEYELGGYPRRVTITLVNHPDAGATATFVIAGKQTTELPVDLVVEEGGSVRIESHANQVAFEGSYSKERGDIQGIIELGSMELPLVLRRAARRPS